MPQFRFGRRCVTGRPLVARERDAGFDRVGRKPHRFAQARFTSCRIVESRQCLTEQQVRGDMVAVDAQRGFGSVASILKTAGQQIHRPGLNLRGRIGGCQLCNLQQLAHDRGYVACPRRHVRELGVGLDRLGCLLDRIAIFNSGILQATL
jgi:hypothetical protein